MGAYRFTPARRAALRKPVPKYRRPRKNGTARTGKAK